MISGNANTDGRNTRFLSLGSYESGRDWSPMFGHMDRCPHWSADLLAGHLLGISNAVACLGKICVTKIVSRVRAGAH